MNKKKITKFFFVFFILMLLAVIGYLRIYKNDKIEDLKEESQDTIYNSNIIKDVEYTTVDREGNEYFIRAEEGEIDFANTNIIFLTNVKALIKLIDAKEVTIVSDFGKYNLENFDTIFSKNVIINYLDNKINGEYLDFSLERNSMIISKNVIYTNLKNILKADVVEIDVKTKDTKIFMYEKEKKVEIKSKKLNGNY